MKANLEIKKGERLLFYGIGNLLRQDDALGIRFIEELEKRKLPSWVALEANYQLNAEDALIVADYDVVVFVDALITEEELSFEVRPVQPDPTLTFSTHAMSVGSVLQLCRELSARNPRVFLLTLPGAVWGIGEGLTPSAQENLDQALAAVTEWICDA